MKSSNKLVNNFRQKLIFHTNPEKAQWLENYVKHGIKSRGVPIPIIREILKKYVKKSYLNEMPQKAQLNFLNELMKDIHTEDKLAAIIYIQIYWGRIDTVFQLRTISNWFEKKWIFDWNVCDWLCVRTLTRLVDSDPKIAVKELKTWNMSPYLWKARASLVAVIYSKSIELHKELISEFSTNLIRRDERFAKTAVGWTLREYSKIDEEFVISFINKNIKYFTKETVNNSLKYMNKNLRREYLTKLNVPT